MSAYRQADVSVPARTAELAAPLEPVRAVSWWVFVCTGLIPLLLPSAWLIAGAIQPGSYDPVRQTISTLSGHAGAHRWIVTGALVVVGLCYIVAAAGLAMLRRAARIGLVVSGGASIGVAACPQPVVGSTFQHMLFTTVGAASIAIWPALTAERGQPASPLTSVPVAAAISALFLVLVAGLLVAAREGTAVGMVERFDSSIEIAWPFLVAMTVRPGFARFRL
jgi:Protein of unknown function (DUF998)